MNKTHLYNINRILYTTVKYYIKNYRFMERPHLFEIVRKQCLCVHICSFGGEESTTFLSFSKGLIILFMVKYLMTWKDAAMYLFYIITENDSFQR